jgi:lysophospholipase L1-like esterase
MKNHPQFVFLFSLLLAAPVWANTATEPAPKDERWMQRHEAFVAEAKQGGIQVLFLGDSITDFWRDTNPQRGGKAVWDREYAPLHAANFGISADRTQNVLWRLEHGEADGYQPKVVVLMIGTNNTGMERDGTTPRNPPAEVVEGVTAVVHELRVKFPDAKILFLAIFPRGEKHSPQRAQVAEINHELAKLHDGQHVFFLDIGRRFLDPDGDGDIPRTIMPDLLHPSLRGYEIWADAIREPLQLLLK